MEQHFGKDSDTLDVTLCYTELSSSQLGSFLIGLGDLADECARLHRNVPASHYSQPRVLLAQTIHTGESVKFSFAERWLPTFSTAADGSFEITLPKKLGVPLLVGYLMLSGAKLVLDVQNAYDDHRIKQIDIELKQLEIQLKQHEIGALLDDKSAMEELRPSVMQVIMPIVFDPTYTSFRINDIDLLERTDGQRETGHAGDRD